MQLLDVTALTTWSHMRGVITGVFLPSMSENDRQADENRRGGAVKAKATVSIR